MNPHFIFNALNSIQLFILQKDELAANRYLTKFSTLIRLILEHSGQETISLEEELKMLQLYLEIESLCRNERFAYQIRLDPELDIQYIRIPPMLIQPFVENAILHGLEDLPDNGRIDLFFTAEADRLVCVVEDNGIGINAGRARTEADGSKAHQSLGIEATINRLQLLNPQETRAVFVRITDLGEVHADQSGTRINLKIPIH